VSWGPLPRLSGEEIMVGFMFELLGATPEIAQLEAPEAPSAGCLVTSNSSPGRPPRHCPTPAGVALIRA